MAVTRTRSDSLATLTERAYQAVRHLILHGELESGSIISERLLAERLRMGKAPIRAAVQRLASKGFLSIEPRRGIIVLPQSIQDILDLYEIRVVLEQLAVRQIAGRLRPEHVDRLRAKLADHREVARQRDPAQTLVSDLEFHRLLCEFHGNTHLTAMLNRILDSLFPELLVSHKKSPDRMLEAVGEHEAVAAAVFQGDAAEAERLMARHLGSCQQFIMSRGARNDGRKLGAESADSGG